MKQVRLAKFLADSGVASRRESERLIESGAVSVNDKIITTPVFFVSGDEKITVNGNIIRKDDNRLVYAFHKPINTITSASDPSGRTTVYDVLKTVSIIHNPSSLKYVGRLDYKTTGLLLLTNDGELARRLTLPSSNIARVYIATLHPEAQTALMRKFLSPMFSDETIFDTLRRGAMINKIKYAPMQIDVLSRYPLQVKITLTEGKKNEIRIAMDHIGFMVKKLHRISYGPIELGDLPAGKIRELSEQEIKTLTGY